MSIDLSSITEIRDKIGIITQIADASGRVLWSAVKKVTITVIVDNEAECFPYIEHNGIVYEHSVTFTANIGDTIYCDVGSTDYSLITVNGEEVGDGYPYYNYEVISDATINLHSYYSYHGEDEYYNSDIDITEIPEGQILFTISGTNYFADEGMTWTEWFASAYNTTGETEGNITDANGNEVSMDAVIIGGTAYEVGFAKMVTLTIIGASRVDAVYVIVDGTQYCLAQTYALEVPVGTIVTCAIRDTAGKYSGTPANVSVNGTVVMENTSSTFTTYDYVATKNATIMQSRKKYENKDDNEYVGYITITEE